MYFSPNINVKIKSRTEKGGVGNVTLTEEEEKYIQNFGWET